MAIHAPGRLASRNLRQRPILCFDCQPELHRREETVRFRLDAPNASKEEMLDFGKQLIKRFRIGGFSGGTLTSPIINYQRLCDRPLPAAVVPAADPCLLNANGSRYL
jgi:hypothetical protein